MASDTLSDFTKDAMNDNDDERQQKTIQTSKGFTISSKSNEKERSQTRFESNPLLGRNDQTAAGVQQFTHQLKDLQTSNLPEGNDNVRLQNMSRGKSHDKLPDFAAVSSLQLCDQRKGR